MPTKFFPRVNMLYETVFLCIMLTSLGFASDRGSDWNYEETHNEVRDFVAGGMVHVRLSVGDLHIKRGDSDKIRVHYTIKSHRESHLKNAHVDIDTRGRDASIEFHAPTSGNTSFDVELELPQNTNLDVHEKVGDLTVENIDGDKDLDLGVGDIRVEAERSNYHLVRASSSIGEVNGEGYGESSGWLGKTLKYQGDGKYELRAHVSVGDISLDEK
ncbi:MAG: DUF4097 family beta strand repeat-containing protein [Candidatus Sulfotelmatobacter sp.]